MISTRPRLMARARGFAGPASGRRLAPEPVLLTTAALYGRMSRVLKRITPAYRSFVLVLPKDNARMRDRLLTISRYLAACGNRVELVDEA